MTSSRTVRARRSRPRRTTHVPASHGDAGGEEPSRPRWGGRVPVARRNLLAERARLLMSVGGVAFAVLLILVVTSLYRGWSAAGGVFAELPGDIWLTQVGTSDPLRTSSALPAGAAGEITSIPGTSAVIPAYARRIAVEPGSGALSVYFMALDVPDRTSWPSAARRFLPRPGFVVVDAVFAKEAGLTVGDTIEVLGRPLAVERIESGGNPIFEIAFMNGSDGRQLLALEGYVSYFLVVLEDGAERTAVERALVQAIPGSETHTAADFAEATSDLVNQGFLPVVGALVAIGFAIGGAVIALTIYTATIEKARDFAVLKAIGADDRFVYRIVVEQSLGVGAVGAALGILSSSLVATLVRQEVPEFVTELRPADAAAVFVVAVLVSAVAAVVPVRRISRIDPAMVFRA